MWSECSRAGVGNTQVKYGWVDVNVHSATGGQRGIWYSHLKIKWSTLIINDSVWGGVLVSDRHYKNQHYLQRVHLCRSEISARGSPGELILYTMWKLYRLLTFALIKAQRGRVMSHYLSQWSYNSDKQFRSGHDVQMTTGDVDIDVIMAQ